MTDDLISRTVRFTITTSLALALAACGGSGTTRIASIGTAASDTAAADGNDSGGGNTAGGDATTSSGGSGTSDNISASGGGTGVDGFGETGSGGGDSDNGRSGNRGAGTPAGPLLVTAGNAVIGLGDKHAGIAGRVNGRLPAATPVTGTVTAVLRRSGQTLVDLGNGQSAVLNRAGGAIGKLVTIDLGTGRVVGAPGATALIGVAALTPTQLASAAIASPTNGTGALGKVGTVASNAVATVTGTLGGTTSPTQPVAGLPTALPATGSLSAVLTGSASGSATASAAPTTGLIPAATSAVGSTLTLVKGKLGK